MWAEAWFVESVASNASPGLEVVEEASPVPDVPFEPGPRLLQLLASGISTEVEDPRGAVYRAKLLLAGETIVSTPLARVLRGRTHHLPDPPGSGIGRDFLSVTTYLTLFHGEDRAELLVVLGNDYRGSDRIREGDPNPDQRPLGSVRFRRFGVRFADRRLRVVHRFARENWLSPPAEEGGGGLQHLLGPALGLWLGDGTCKAFSMVLGADSVSEESLVAAAHAPLLAIPEVETVRASGAFNAHGGPAPPGAATSMAVASELNAWRRCGDFGPFGGFGDAKDAAANGTPRNGTSSLHQVIRGGSSQLLLKAHAQVLQQALRPYHLHGLEKTEESELYLQGLPVRMGDGWVGGESLGRAALPDLDHVFLPGKLAQPPGPHGFSAPDYEHFSVDLLYDFYCLTGSPFALAELRMLAEQLKALLGRSGPFHDAAFSSRGEGWCMKALVLCHLATGDEALRRLGVDRLRRVLDRDRGRGGYRYAVAQAPHPVVLGGERRWDAPWQQAAFVLGMHAGSRFFEDPLFTEVAVDVANAMAVHGWVDKVGPKYFVDVADPSVFSMAIGESPLAGTAVFLSPAFVVAAELAGQESEAGVRMLRRTRELFEPHRVYHVIGGGGAEEKWFQVFMDRFPSGVPLANTESRAGSR